jgi:hypothetical protein
VANFSNFIFLALFWLLRLPRGLIGLLGIAMIWKGLSDLAKWASVQYGWQSVGGHGLLPLEAAVVAYIVLGAVGVGLFALTRRLLVALYRRGKGLDHPRLAAKFWAI